MSERQATLERLRAHPADTYNTVKAREACPWLSVDESLRLPGWLLETLHEATAATIRGRILLMSDRYWISVLQRRVDDLSAESTKGEKEQ